MNITREFARSLRDKLLADNYGRWKNLDPQFLTSLCDRIGEEVEDFIQQECYFPAEEGIFVLSTNSTDLMTVRP